MLLTKPEDPVPHIIQFLQEQKGTAANPLTKDELIELNMLREERKRLKSKKPKAGNFVNADSSEDSEDEAKKNRDESSSDSEGEALDEVNDPLSPITQ